MNAKNNLRSKEKNMFEINDIRQFVVDTFLFGDGSWLEDDTSFLEEGVIDSAGMLELITFLETKYDVTVADDEVVRDNLDSLGRISRFLASKLERSLEVNAG